MALLLERTRVSGSQALPTSVSGIGVSVITCVKAGVHGVCTHVWCVWGDCCVYIWCVRDVYVCGVCSAGVREMCVLCVRCVCVCEVCLWGVGCWSAWVGSSCWCPLLASTVSSASFLNPLPFPAQPFLSPEHRLSQSLLVP